MLAWREIEMHRCLGTKRGPVPLTITKTAGRVCTLRAMLLTPLYCSPEVYCSIQVTERTNKEWKEKESEKWRKNKSGQTDSRETTDRGGTETSYLTRQHALNGPSSNTFIVVKHTLSIVERGLTRVWTAVVSRHGNTRTNSGDMATPQPVVVTRQHQNRQWQWHDNTRTNSGDETTLEPTVVTWQHQNQQWWHDNTRTDSGDNTRTDSGDVTSWQHQNRQWQWHNNIRLTAVTTR